MSTAAYSSVVAVVLLATLIALAASAPLPTGNCIINPDHTAAVRGNSDIPYPYSDPSFYDSFYSACVDVTKRSECEGATFGEGDLGVSIPPCAWQSSSSGGSQQFIVQGGESSPVASPTPSASPSRNWFRPFIVSNLRNVIQQGSPIAYWPMDDLPTSAMVGRSFAGTGFDGQIVGHSSGDIVVGERGANAVLGSSMRFVGSGGYVVIPNAPFSQAAAGGSWSLSLWFKQGPGTTFPKRLVDSSALVIDIVSPGDAVQVTVGSTVLSIPSQTLSASTWYSLMVTAVSSGGSNVDVSVLLNGVQQTTATIASSSMSFSSSPVFIGRNAGGAWIDEVSLYGTALSASTVQRNVISGLLGPCALNPCYSGTSCTPTGESSYTCGPCPPGFTGTDGSSPCIPTSSEVLLQQQGGSSCAVSPADLTNATFCSSKCSTRTQCYACTMNLDRSVQLLARKNCTKAVQDGRITILNKRGIQFSPSLTASATVTASTSRSPTLSISKSATPSPSISFGLSLTSCLAWYNAGARTDGVYTIYYSGTPYQVQCDMTTDGGGWTLLGVAIVGQHGITAWNSQSALNIASSSSLTSHWHMEAGMLNSLTSRDEFKAVCFNSNNNYIRYWFTVPQYNWNSATSAASSNSKYDKTGTSYPTVWSLSGHFGLVSGADETTTIITAHSGNQWACGGMTAPGGEGYTGRGGISNIRLWGK